MSLNFVTLLLAATIAVSAPLVFAAMGELVSERAGVLNIELEAMMLTGAFAGFGFASITHSLLMGFVGALVGGVLVGLVHGVICFVFGGSQVVSGVVLNILALGATTLGLSLFFGAIGNHAVQVMPPISVPGLVDLPLVGKALFGQNPGAYAALAVVIAVWIILNRSVLGLILRAVGEHPAAAESLGINVMGVRWLALITCGCLAGFGGGQLVLSSLGTFTPNISAGRGFIALAAVIFGRWRPVQTLGAVLLFSLAEVFQIRAQVLGLRIPYQLLAMLPYLVTLIALAGFIRRMRPPRMLGVNYERA